MGDRNTPLKGGWRSRKSALTGEAAMCYMMGTE